MNSIPQSSQQLVELLKSKSLHISAAESCTAGLFSSSLASIPRRIQRYGVWLCHLLCCCQNEPCLCQTGHHQELHCLFRSCRRPNGNRRSSKIRRRAWRWYHRHCRSSCRISACRHCLYRRGQFGDPKCFRSPLSFSGSRPQHHPPKGRTCYHGSCHRRYHFYRPPAPLCLVLQPRHYPYRNRIQNPLILITI